MDDYHITENNMVVTNPYLLISINLWQKKVPGDIGFIPVL